MDKFGFGERTLINNADTTLGGAVFKVFAGKQTDTIFHRLHGKIVYVLSGSLKATVMKDGRASTVSVKEGASFFVKPGLVHNFIAVDDSVLIEFASSEVYSNDTYCIFKGSQPATEDVKPDDVMKMQEEDKKEEPAPAETKKTTTKKTKKKTAKRKTKSKKGK
jgi:quercetin dioxygenase-like cupin family protein